MRESSASVAPGAVLGDDVCHDPVVAVGVELIEPMRYTGRQGRQPKWLHMMLRMYPLQEWFSPSDESVEDAIYDSYGLFGLANWVVQACAEDLMG